MLDGQIYSQVKDYLMSLCQIELDGYQTVDRIFRHLLKVSNGVSLEMTQIENEKLCADVIFIYFGLEAVHVFTVVSHQRAIEVFQ